MGCHQAVISKVQHQDALLAVLWNELAVWRFSRRYCQHNLLPIRFRTYSIGLRCRKREKDLQWHHGLHHENRQELWSYWFVSWMEHHRRWCFRLPSWTTWHFRANHGDEPLQGGQGSTWNGSSVCGCPGGS